MKSRAARYGAIGLLTLSVSTTAYCIDYLDPMDPNSSLVDVIHASDSLSDFANKWIEHQLVFIVSMMTNPQYRTEVLVQIIGTQIPDPQGVNNIPVNEIINQSLTDTLIRNELESVRNGENGIQTDDPSEIQHNLDPSSDITQDVPGEMVADQPHGGGGGSGGIGGTSDGLDAGGADGGDTGGGINA